MIFFVVAAIGILAAVAANGETIMQKVDNSTDAWTRFDSLFRLAGSKYGVPWTWLKAIALNESDLGRYPSVALGIREPANIEGSKSQDGKSWGLMQVTIKTAKLDLDPNATEIKLNDPAYSVDLAAKYLKEKLFPVCSAADARRTEWIIKSYNQGPGNTKKEMQGQTAGYANEYWARFQRNLKRVEDSV